LSAHKPRSKSTSHSCNDPVVCDVWGCCSTDHATQSDLGMLLNRPRNAIRLGDVAQPTTRRDSTWGCCSTDHATLSDLGMLLNRPRDAIRIAAQQTLTIEVTSQQRRKTTQGSRRNFQLRKVGRTKYSTADADVDVDPTNNGTTLRQILRQTSRQTSRQTLRQTSRQAFRQTLSQTRGQKDQRTNGPAFGQQAKEWRH
jgi:hypothetical protein